LEIIFSENQGEEELELFPKQNNYGETALYISTENGHLDIVKELIKYHDVGLASLKARHGFDAFYVAAKNGNLGMFVKFKCIQMFRFRIFTIYCIHGFGFIVIKVTAIVTIVSYLDCILCGPYKYTTALPYD
jgi:hypothetical protein